MISFEGHDGEDSNLESLLKTHLVILLTDSSDLKIQLKRGTVASVELYIYSLFSSSYYVVWAAGIAAIQVIRALHTPLQDVTFGSGSRLRMQTFDHNVQN